MRNNKYSLLLSRVSKEMLRAYELETNTNLNYENNKFVSSETSINNMLKLMLGLMGAFIVIIVLLAIELYKIGSIAKFLDATMFVAAVTLLAGLAISEVSRKKIKVRNASRAILDKFDEDIAAIEQQRHWAIRDRRFINEEKVRENLLAMAREVVEAEGLERYARWTIKFDSIRDVCGISNNVREKIKVLQSALKRLPHFGLSYLESDLLLEAAKKQ